MRTLDARGLLASGARAKVERLIRAHVVRMDRLAWKPEVRDQHAFPWTIERDASGGPVRMVEDVRVLALRRLERDAIARMAPPARPHLYKTPMGYLALVPDARRVPAFEATWFGEIEEMEVRRG